MDRLGRRRHRHGVMDNGGKIATGLMTYLMVADLRASEGNPKSSDIAILIKKNLRPLFNKIDTHIKSVLSLFTNLGSFSI